MITHTFVMKLLSYFFNYVDINYMLVQIIYLTYDWFTYLFYY